MIFIFIAINHIISLKQTNLYFGHVRQKFSLRVLLSFCLIFVNFSLVLLIKVLLFKKSVYIRNKKFKVAKCEHVFRVGWVTSSRGTFFKKRLQHRCCLVNIAELLRTSFSQNTSGSLRLILMLSSIRHQRLYNTEKN